MNVAENELRSFLEECKVKKKEPFTHTTKSTQSLVKNWSAASYYISDEYLEDFWTIYCNAIRKGVSPTLTEKPGVYSCRIFRRGDPQVSAISSWDTAPSLIMVGTSPLTSITVDSIPPGHSPPSIIRSTSPPNCS